LSAYPLGVVLSLREREADAARARLARALAVEATRAAALDEANARRAERSARLEHALCALLTGEGGAGALEARSRWAGRLRGEVAALTREVAAAAATLAVARADVEAARGALSDARGALRAVERHRDGWRAAASRRREGAEEAEVDERVSALRAAP
jgi:hypothetical protein